LLLTIKISCILVVICFLRWQISLAEILAERYRRVIPPNITGDAPNAETEKLMHQASDKIQQLTGLVGELTKELKDKQAELTIKDREMSLREKEVGVEQQRLDYDSETKRVVALGNSGPAISQEQIQPVLRELLAGMIQNGELTLAGVPAPHEGGTPIQLPPEPTDGAPTGNGAHSGDEGEDSVPGVAGSRQAADGNHYIPHPDGGYARIEQQ